MKGQQKQQRWWEELKHQHPYIFFWIKKHILYIHISQIFTQRSSEWLIYSCNVNSLPKSEGECWKSLLGLKILFHLMNNVVVVCNITSLHKDKNFIIYYFFCVWRTHGDKIDLSSCVPCDDSMMHYWEETGVDLGFYAHLLPGIKPGGFPIALAHYRSNFRWIWGLKKLNIKLSIIINNNKMSLVIPYTCDKYKSNLIQIYSTAIQC